MGFGVEFSLQSFSKAFLSWRDLGVDSSQRVFLAQSMSGFMADSQGFLRRIIS
jgi:hypothetical protein